MSTKGPAWTIADAADRCGVSRSTVRRYRESDRFPNAFKDPMGMWKIPETDLRAVGWTVTDPDALDPAAAAAAAAEERARVAEARVRELEAVVELARVKGEAAENKASAAEDKAAMALRHLDDMRGALLVLERYRPAEAVSAPEYPAGTHQAPTAPSTDATPERGTQQPSKRRWWQW